MSNHPLIIHGTHIIIDIYDIENTESLKFTDNIITILNNIVNKFNLNVVGKAIHQFEPFGVTGVYILSESHLSIHTFVEEGKVAMDLYTCSDNRNFDDIVKYIKLLYDDDDCIIRFKVIKR